METDPHLLLASAQEIVQMHEGSPFYAEIKKEQYDLIINQKFPGLPTVDEDLENLASSAPPPQPKAKDRFEELELAIAEKVHQENSLVLVDTNQFECFFYGINDDDFRDCSSPSDLAYRIWKKTQEALFWSESYFFNRPRSDARAFLGVYTIESICKEATNRWIKTSGCFNREISQYKDDSACTELSANFEAYDSATRILLQNMPCNFYTVPDSRLYQKLKEMAYCMKDKSNNSNNGWDADGELIATKLGLEILGEGPATILTADKMLKEREQSLIAVLKDGAKEYFQRKFIEQSCGDKIKCPEP